MTTTLSTEQTEALRREYAEATASEDKGFTTGDRLAEGAGHGSRLGLTKAVQIITGLSYPEAVNLLEGTD